MLKRASSNAIVTASESMAALAAAYGPRNGGKPPRTVLLLTHNSKPCCCCRNTGNTALLTRCAPRKLLSNTLATSSGVNASLGPITRWPALCTTASSRPRSAMMLATAASAESCDSTSSSTARTSAPWAQAQSRSSRTLAALRPWMSRMLAYTLWPASASALTDRRPMPVPAPVTRTMDLRMMMLLWKFGITPGRRWRAASGH